MKKEYDDLTISDLIESFSGKKNFVVIKADCNDADYISEISDVNSDDIKFIKYVWGIISKRNGRWENGEYGDIPPRKMYKNELTEKEIERFSSFLPYGEYGIHTVESIKIYRFVSCEEL